MADANDVARAQARADATDMPLQAKHEFLLESYRGWLESMHKSEALGEKRIEFFITFATAVLGAVFGLFGAKFGRDSVLDPHLAVALVRSSVIGLLILGFVTFLRIVRRNQATDRFRRNLVKIERIYLPEHTLVSAPHLQKPRPLSNGGLVVMMLAMESMLFGLAIAVWFRGSLAVALGVVGCVVGFAVLLILMRTLESQGSGSS